MAINISKQLAEAGGSGMGRHKNTMLPGLIGTFSDAKVKVYFFYFEVYILYFYIVKKSNFEKLSTQIV